MNKLRKPSWIRSKIPSGDNYKEIRIGLKERNLFTVCQEANCPNQGECWEQKTATIMILGDTCTRACKFCSVKTGNPKGQVDQQEIEKSKEMIDLMGLKYIVITSVDRDDLADFGASHFANLVAELGRSHPNVKVEVLIPDFAAIEKHMHTLAKSDPFVIAHNLETVRELTKKVRDPRASYEKSLSALKFYKTHYPEIATKSSLMLGLGENMNQIISTLEDLKEAKVDIVTLGQYLQPSKKHLKVKQFYTPKEFDDLKKLSYQMGFKFVASGPMVRSSYRAADYIEYLSKDV